MKLIEFGGGTDAVPKSAVAIQRFQPPASAAVGEIVVKLNIDRHGPIIVVGTIVKSKDYDRPLNVRSRTKELWDTGRPFYTKRGNIIVEWKRITGY